MGESGAHYVSCGAHLEYPLLQRIAKCLKGGRIVYSYKCESQWDGNKCHYNLLVYFLVANDESCGICPPPKISAASIIMHHPQKAKS